MKPNEKQFATTDFGLATTLVCLDFELCGLDKTNARKIKFVFQETSELRKAVADFWANRISVNPKVFFSEQKNLKSRMYSGS